ncbi:MAG: chemotaxis protein CheW [Magnetovibrionaceae bacterium]
MTKAPIASFGSDGALVVADAPVAPVHPGDLHQFITFRIGEEEYGTDILDVHEIIAWTGVTKLPNTQPHLRGVMNLRGSILPVFDLRARFGMGDTEASEFHVIVIVKVADKLVGMLADAVAQILQVTTDELQPPPDHGLMVDQEYLDCFATSGERMVAILDVQKLFDLSELERAVQTDR